VADRVDAGMYTVEQTGRNPSRNPPRVDSNRAELGDTDDPVLAFG
jgi:hypothetical protein